jgi:thiosulfate/3-mercaptopyruvate sulfurtransferase
MNTHAVELTTDELAQSLRQPGLVLVDLRSVEAFNGWPLGGEARGGHIDGAVSFPFAWSRYEFEVQELLHSKGIKRDKTVVLYGYEPEQTEQFAATLRRIGYEDVRHYHRFVEEWAADEQRPMTRLERWQMLVSPDWLHELISGKRPDTYEHNRYVVCHSHYDYVDDYDKGHIPGAVALNTNDLESPEDWNRRSPEELRRALEAHGITHDTTVVMYGRFSFPDNNDPYPGRAAGHLGAIRSAAILLYAGVKDVRILNGGLNRWEDAGLPVTTDRAQPTPADDFGAKIPGRPDLFVDMDGARELLASDDGDLVSVRSWPEFIGQVSGYNYIEKKGRIPGAVFGNCGSDAYHMENYRNLDYTTRDFHETERAWAEAGITADKHIAFYCGTGWRGSEAFLNAYLMGWPRASVYDGGWMEWSSDPNNPVGTGIPDKAEKIRAVRPTTSITEPSAG